MRSLFARFMLASLFITGLASSSLAWASNTVDAWPKIKLPRYIQLFNMGQKIDMNGLPMSIKGFVATQAPQTVLADIRETMKQPLVENKLGPQWILGSAVGEHYITIQVEPAGSGSRGIVAITDIKRASDSKFISQQEKEQWQTRLPSGSVLQRNIKSIDGDKSSQHLIFSNNQSTSLNIDRIKSLLKEDGLSLEREISTQKNFFSTDQTQGHVLYFSGNKKEAMATLHQDTNGQTITVLNITTQSPKVK